MIENPSEQPLFYGQSKHTLDHKNRITIPAKWRSDGVPETFFVIPHPSGDCLLLLPPNEFRAVGEKVRNAPDLAQRDKRAFQRQFFSQAEHCVADKQGRLLLPDEHCARVELAKEVLLVGAETQIQVWSPGKWSRAKALELSAYERVAEEHM
jgi:MraZ protein